MAPDRLPENLPENLPDSPKDRLTDRSTDCLTESAVLDYVDGRLQGELRAACDVHLSECTECRQLVSALAGSTRLRPDPLGPTTPAAAVGMPLVAFPDTLRRGAILNEKFRVERVLGSGGMGIVLEATHLVLEQKVAIKFLQPEVCKVPGAKERFLREARAAAQIRGEHVVRVMDTGTLEGGAPYMVMELLLGVDLAHHIAAKGRLPIDEAVFLLLQACEAIAEAHEAGIVHRDLKPANLFLTTRPDGSSLVKVLDFGISKQLEGSDSAGLTSRDVMMGSPRYMSPEQMKSTRDVDARTDLWALGVILYELTTGSCPFEGETTAALCAAILKEPAPKVTTHIPDAPAALERVLEKCLSKDPAARFQSVAELAIALRPLSPERAFLHIDRIAGISRHPGAASGSSEADVRRPPRPQGTRTVAALAALIGAALLASLALLARPAPSSAVDPKVTPPPPSSASPSALPEVVSTPVWRAPPAAPSIETAPTKSASKPHVAAPAGAPSISPAPAPSTTAAAPPSSEPGSGMSDRK